MDISSASGQFLFFGGACLITLVITPFIKRFAFNHQVTAVSGGRRLHQGVTPLLGGIAIYTPVGIVFLILIILSSAGVIRFREPSFLQIVSLFIGSLSILILGSLDDRFKISWRLKLSGQFLAAFILVMGGHTIGSATLPLLGPVYFDWMGAPLFMILVVGVTNAINIIDGIDGLAGGICMMASITIGVIGFYQGDAFAAILGFTIAGATLGFLFYNFPPASIFMGDGGSMTLGFLLATLATSSAAVYPGLRLGASAMIAIPFIPFTIPIFETLLSITRRWLRGKPIFSGDGDHLHHRLMRALRNPRRTVLIFYFFNFICCVFTLMLTLQPRSDLARLIFVMTGLVLFSGAIAALSLYRLGEIFVALRNRPFFRFLSSFRQFMGLKMRRCDSLTELIDLAEAGVNELGFDEIELVAMGYIVRKWRNHKKIHPDMPRVTHEESFGNGELRIKWVAPVHHDPGYNDFLFLTWRRFLDDLWNEIVARERRAGNGYKTSRI